MSHSFPCRLLTIVSMVVMSLSNITSAREREVLCEFPAESADSPADRYFRQAIASVDNPNVYFRQALDLDTDTPSDFLAILAGDPHWAVRALAALNTSTPGESLTELVRDVCPDVRGIAARTLFLRRAAEFRHHRRLNQRLRRRH